MKTITAFFIVAPIFFGSISLINSCHKSSETIKKLENDKRYLLNKVHKKQQKGGEVHLIKGEPLILGMFEPAIPDPKKALQAEEKCHTKAKCDIARANLFANKER
jgi:hypothetical protein